jgi:hypothetical protein
MQRTENPLRALHFPSPCSHLQPPLNPHPLFLPPHATSTLRRQLPPPHDLRVAVRHRSGPLLTPASPAAAFSLRIAPHRQTLATANTMPPHRGRALSSTSFWGVYAQSSGNYATEITTAGIQVWIGTSPPWKRPPMPTMPPCGGFGKVAGGSFSPRSIAGRKLSFLPQRR